MLKIRLKRLGAKKAPSYRIIVINSTTKREGKPVQELGYYNPKTKVMQLDKAAAEAWIKKGAQPTETVAYLIKNCNADGTLNYQKKETVKLSKKAQAKAAAEEPAAASFYWSRGRIFRRQILTKKNRVRAPLATSAMG